MSDFWGVRSWSWFVFVHELFDLLRIIGVRDRLRCPVCSKVGTWKPHGGWLDRWDKRKVRRWLCKWCGYYVGPEGEKECSFDADTSTWRFADEPRMVKEFIPIRDLPMGLCDPWRG